MRSTEATAVLPRPGRLERWDPEDPDFWESTGRRVARRNLAVSILTEHLGFCVWLLWSIGVLHLADAGMDLSVGQILWLTTVPNLVGAVLRIPYTFAPARFGGRNWTMISALLLLIPCALFVSAVQNPDLPYWALLVAAAATGLGGGNFASSMSNITHFYPTDKQGLPLGLNAAGGNVGVSVAQLVLPPVIIAFGLAAAGWLWMPLVVLAAVLAYRFMDNLPGTGGKYSPAEMAAVALRPQTMIMSVLYIGTFGSFIGYGFSFGVLMKSRFPDVDASDVIWLGALVGSVARPLGGLLADRLGGARVTFVTFVAMVAGIAVVWVAVDGGSFPLFLGAFLWVFAMTGIGNGSTYRMIPAIFKVHALESVDRSDRAAVARALGEARRGAAAAVGLCSAVGAFGGVLVQQTFRISLERTGSISAALVVLAAFSVLCLTLTWAAYLRRVQVGGRRVSLAEVGV